MTKICPRVWTAFRDAFVHVPRRQHTVLLAAELCFGSFRDVFVRVAGAVVAKASVGVLASFRDVFAIRVAQRLFAESCLSAWFCHAFVRVARLLQLRNPVFGHRLALCLFAEAVLGESCEVSSCASRSGCAVVAECCNLASC